MKLEINATIPEIEFANFLLGLAYKETKNNTFIQAHYNIRPEQIEEAEKFREKLVNAYLQSAEKLSEPCAA